MSPRIAIASAVAIGGASVIVLLAPGCGAPSCDGADACAGNGLPESDGSRSDAPAAGHDATVNGIDSSAPGDGSPDAGDGSGEGAFDGPPPGIVTLMPANGSDNVYVRAPIEAVFSQPVQLGASPAALTSSGSVRLAASAMLAADSRTLVLSPVSGLIAPTTLTAVLGDVFDHGGRRAPSPAWSWTLPRWLTVGDAINDPGLLIAVAAGPGDQIALASYVGNNVSVRSVAAFNDRWISLGSFPAHRNGTLPRLAIDPGGALVLGFVDDTNTVRVKRWSGTSWSDVGAPLAAGATSNGVMSMALGAGGSIYIADDEPVDGGSGVVVHALAGNVWAQLGPVVGTGLAPSLAVDRSGTPYVAYTSGGFIQVSHWSGTAWVPVGSGALNLATDGGGPELASIVSIAFDDADELFVLGSFDDGLDLLFRVFLLISSRWYPLGAPFDSMPRGAVTVPFVSPAAGTNGHVYAAWASQSDSGPGIGMADVTSRGWTALDPPPPARAPLVAAAAVNPNGVPVAAWSESSPDAAALQVRLLNQ